MSDKRQIRTNIKRLQRVKTWQLVIVLLLVAIVAATFLRLNNIGMIERRNAVIAADKSGNIEDIQYRLYDLQRYVNQHMNTGTGRVVLEQQYQRDSQKAKDAVTAQNNSGQGAKVQQAAIAVCDPIAKANNWRWPDPRYISCIDSELSKYPGATGSVGRVELPDTKLYHHEFIAPVWSADFAGWSVLICGLILLIVVTRIATIGVLRLLLKRQYRSV